MFATLNFKNTNNSFSRVYICLLLPTDQKVTGLNPVGVTNKILKPIENQVDMLIFGGFCFVLYASNNTLFLCTFARNLVKFGKKWSN